MGTTNFVKGIETFFCFKVWEMANSKLNDYIKRNLVCFSLDEDGNLVLTVARDGKFYKVPDKNMKFWFPEEYYENGELKGHFRKLKKISKRYHAIYKMIDSEDEFEVNKKLRILSVSSDE